jgi:putative zinc finger/helix-turn-helix YgiT family protein
MHPSPTAKKTKPNLERSFPMRCRRCGQQQVYLATVKYNASVRHDGRLHSFTIPKLLVPTCKSCGEKVFTEDVDAQVNNALRSHLRLLTPDQIRSGIKRVEMSQKTFAARIGIAEETLSRWLNEAQIQSRAMDNLLRAFFAFPQLRLELSGTAQNPDFGLNDSPAPRAKPRSGARSVAAKKSDR